MDTDEMLQRLFILNDKVVAEGPEALDEDDKAFLDAVLKTIQPMLEKLVEAVSELAKEFVAALMSAYNSLPPETRAAIIAMQTESPVEAQSISSPMGGRILDANSFHDHVSIEVANLVDMPSQVERMEQRWRS